MKTEIINYLYTLINKRFKNKNEIIKYLKEEFYNYKISLYYNEDSLPTNDYSLIGTIENKEFLCDFDIFYAKTRAREMIITEITHNFELK